MINFRWQSPPTILQPIPQPPTILQPIPQPPLSQQPPPQFQNMPPQQLERQIAREQQQLTIHEQQLIIEEQQRRIDEQQRRIDEQQRRIDEQQLIIDKKARLYFDYIQMAGQIGTPNFIDHFKKNQMPTDQPDCFGRTLLHCAVYYNDLKSVKFLLGQHVNSRDKEVMYVNSRDKEGLTALHYGAHKGNIEAVKALLQTKGVDPNLGDKNGMTALHYVARAGKIEAVKALLSASNNALEAEEVNPNPGDKKGMTPLHYASYNASFKVVEALIAHYEARGKKMDVNETGIGKEGSLSRKKPMELATLSTLSDYEKIRTMAVLYKYGGKIEGEQFFSNLYKDDGEIKWEEHIKKPETNKLISRDLNDNIRRLNDQDRESFSVNGFMIDVEARAKFNEDIARFNKDIARDNEVHEELSLKNRGPSERVNPLDGRPLKKARFLEGQQSERAP